jgi:hypothetical protein
MLSEQVGALFFELSNHLARASKFTLDSSSARGSGLFAGHVSIFDVLVLL